VIFCAVVFYVDTEVSAEHTTSIFRPGVYKVRSRLGYIGTLQARWSRRPIEGGGEIKTGPDQSELSRKTIFFRGNTMFFITEGKLNCDRTLFSNPLPWV
jgi:hypothetical protein